MIEPLPFRNNLETFEPNQGVNRKEMRDYVFDDFDKHAIDRANNKNLFQDYSTLKPVSPKELKNFYDHTTYESRYNNDAFRPVEGNDFENEPPLLDELGINPRHIWLKTFAVLNPVDCVSANVLEDTDLAGPLVFCLTFAAFLLLKGKVAFSYIYGIGGLSSIAFYCLLSLMATKSCVTFCSVVSILGYCLLPMVILSGLNVLIPLEGLYGLIVTTFAIIWCAVSASKLFVTTYSMEHQQWLIAYPCAALYVVFALITVF